MLSNEINLLNNESAFYSNIEYVKNYTTLVKHNEFYGCNYKCYIIGLSIAFNVSLLVHENLTIYPIVSATWFDIYDIESNSLILFNKCIIIVGNCCDN